MLKIPHSEQQAEEQQGTGLLLELIYYFSLRVNPTILVLCPFSHSWIYMYLSHHSTIFSEVSTFSPCTDKLQRRGKRMGH